MPRQIQGSQNDFSAGEVDVSLKRADQHPARKAGARQMSNWRILNSKAISNRPGRSVLFFEPGRVEEVLMSPGNQFYLVFGNGYLRIYNAAGTLIFNTTVKGDGATAIPWSSANLSNVSFAIYQYAIYIAYSAGAPQNVPQVLTWDGVSQTSTWTLTTFAETIDNGQKRTPFDRISPQNIQMLPSGRGGDITITFSGPVLAPGMVGTRLSYLGRQLTITGVTDAENGTATCAEILPPSEEISFSTDPATVFTVGDEVTGATTSSKGIVVAVDNESNSIQVQLIPPSAGFATELLVGPNGSLTIEHANPTVPASVSIWNDEVMNEYRGYPSSVSFDQNRLIFSNFPALPGAIGWSTIGLPTDMWVDPVDATESTDNAIFELVPGKNQVLYVVAGMESSEFVFCDNAIYYVPISTQSPLVPGSVGFVALSSFGAMPGVQPRLLEQTLVYVKAGGLQIGAIQAPGAYSRPYVIDNISELHSHLFKASQPVAIAAPAASSQFEEQYIYVLLANGTLAVGQYKMRNGLLEPSSDGGPNVGWVPWSGTGSVAWISALNETVLFVTSYAPNNIGAVSVVEQLDNSQYLDSAVSVNNLPAALAAARPAGKGPLWWLAGGSVFLIDLETRFMGVYGVDANGNIVPQFTGGEDLASAQLVAGQPWTATLEPFAQDAPSGQDMHQRMLPRRISFFAVYVENSTGFFFAKLFSGKLTPTSPALGAVMNIRRVPAWNTGEDPTKAAPLRETVEEWRPSGYSYDPRVAITKDTPGPLMIQEVAVEISI